MTCHPNSPQPEECARHFKGGTRGTFPLGHILGQPWPADFAVSLQHTKYPPIQDATLCNKWKQEHQAKRLTSVTAQADLKVLRGQNGRILPQRCFSMRFLLSSQVCFILSHVSESSRVTPDCALLLTRCSSKVHCGKSLDFFFLFQSREFILNLQNFTVNF